MTRDDTPRSPLSPFAVPPLAVEGLAVGHDGRRVLERADFQIEAGRFTVLLGPNGSGKSTLLAAMARLLPPMAGSVLLDGADIARLPTRAVSRKLGLLPQQPLVPEGLSVFDLVSRGRFPHQGLFRQWSAADEAAVGRAMAVTGVADLAARGVDSLSGGQRQRVWIAMVLAQETPVILLDEPTTFLDMRHQIDILAMLATLVRDHGRTIVCVLHDLNLALQHADRFLFLKGGGIRHRLDHPAACTAAIVGDVFDMPVAGLSHPETGLPVFVPISAPTSMPVACR
ncbi:ABC transporter ATP-binding protein [Azospirillum thiophilum]|nr:ABC transporter ATP-binding protein [Azospirillum thiophilum]